MVENSVKSSKKPSRQRKRRRTEPEEISSPSSSSSSESDLSNSKRASKDRRDRTASPKASHTPAKIRKKSQSKHKHGEVHPANNTVQLESLATASVPSTKLDNGEPQDESDKMLPVKLSSAGSGTLPSSTVAAAPAAVPPQPQTNIDSDFESWYIRAMTSKYENDLDRLRTDAADFKARPREAVTMLSRALRQGVALFEPDDIKLIMGASKGLQDGLIKGGV